MRTKFNNKKEIKKKKNLKSILAKHIYQIGKNKSRSNEILFKKS